jgi:glycosyltransferase involved in cell wall biosynthesis
VLPAYNEEQVIGATVTAVVSILERLCPDYEVIVVDDGSRDGTAEVVGQLSVENPRVRRVSHSRNRGYGAALATGFSAAGKELVFLTDGDKQFNVEQLEQFLPLLGEADLVIGYRAPRADPASRRLFGWGWNVLVRLLFGYVARDVDCAFKLFRRNVWTATTVHSRGIAFSAEFLIKSRRRGFRVRELRASHYPRSTGTSTIGRPVVVARAIRELVRLRLNIGRELREDPIFAEMTVEP